MVFFSERLNRLKIIAVAVSSIGIATAFLVAEIVPFISVCIALSSGAYGLMRKRSALDSATGLLLYFWNWGGGGGRSYLPVDPRVMYALNENDHHILRAKTMLRLVCVFPPALSGFESHKGGIL